ncbi:MAG: cardiolipin synthase [Verrucomicrobiota bacterium]
MLSPLAAIWTLSLVAIEIIGIATAFVVVMRSRTSQGAIAWVVALIAFPLVTLPLYWLFGRNRFQGYVETLNTAIEEQRPLVAGAREALQPHHGVFDRYQYQTEYALDRLTARQFTRGNSLTLLIDGPQTFEAIFHAIDNARSYIIVEFFIIKDDKLGTRLKNKLIAKTKEKVLVYVLYDELGSVKLSREYITDLRTAGAKVSAFGGSQGHRNRLQINFRNHRKIVIVDGSTGFVGGLNVGDQYLGKNPRFGRWRDTFLHFEGPAVQGTQAVFAQDWYWATRSFPQFNWSPNPSEKDDAFVLPLDTGPVNEIEACTLFFHELISSATKTLWIASPYFVPDEGLVAALQLAAVRGVDVRIMLPANPDHLLVWLASFSYLEQMESAGVKMFRYHGGFLHQKVALVDDHIAFVGTANLDNRSMRLNFELSMVVSDKDFATQIRTMLETDFSECVEVNGCDYTCRNLAFRIAVRTARLLAPIL